MTDTRDAPPNAGTGADTMTDRADPRPRIVIDRPVFVLGYARSGTTMLRRMLNCHPGLFVPPESEIFQRLPEALPAVVREPGVAVAAMDALPDDVARIFDLSRARALVRAAVPFPKAQLFALLHDAALDAKPGARWGHKKPSEWPFVGTMRRWYPRAQFVHIVRNPHDVIASIKVYTAQGVQLHNVAPSPVLSAWHWRAAMRELLREERRLGPGRYHRIVYEELVAAPEETLTVLCRFLDLSPEAVSRMVAFHAEAVPERLREHGVHQAQTGRPVNAASLGRARQDFDERTLAAIDHVTRRERVRLGYPALAARSVGPLRGALLDMRALAYAAAWLALRGWRKARGRL